MDKLSWWQIILILVALNIPFILIYGPWFPWNKFQRCSSCKEVKPTKGGDYYGPFKSAGAHPTRDWACATCWEPWLFQRAVKDA